VATTTPGTAITSSPGSTGNTASTASGVRIHLISDRGRPLPGLTVTVTPSASTAVSQRDGIATIPLPPGTYSGVVSSGCGGDYFVEQPATARFAVPEGKVVDGNLQVAAVRRVAPAKPSDFEGNGTWRVGQAHRLTFSTVDRCTNQPAANASLALTTFVAGPGYQVAGTAPNRTFEDGRSFIDIACTADNADPSLIAKAVGDDRDQIDLLSFDVLARNPPNCIT
jgi:hypothetical protein